MLTLPKTITLSVLTSTAMTGALTLLVSTSLLMPTASFAASIKSKLLEAADTKSSGDYVRTRFLKALNSPVHPNAKKQALIIGDSHAQDFFNSVLENGYLKDYQIRTRYIPVRCQITLSNNTSKHIADKDKAFCEKSDSLAKAKKQIATADVIIMASFWKQWSAKELPETIKQLNLSQRQELFIIGRKSYGKISVRNYLRMPEEKLKTLRTKVDSNQQPINNLMSKTLSHAIFVNQHQLVCGTGRDCPVFTNDTELISYDGGHLTKAGAQYVGKILFEGSALGKL